VRVFGLVDADIGQSLIGIPTTVPIQGLRDSLLHVVHGGDRCTLEATSEDISYLLQVMPYQNRERQTLGAIITLTDVSEMVALRRAAEASLHEFESLADSLEQAVWKKDRSCQRILYISSRIYDLLGWNPPEICSQPALLDEAILPNEQAFVMHSRLEGNGATGWEITYQMKRRDGEVRLFREVAIILDGGDDASTVFGTLSDITEQQAILNQKQFLGSAFESLMECDPLPIALLDATLQLVAMNGHFIRSFGGNSDDLSCQTIDDLAKVLILLDQANPGAQTPAPGALRTLAEQAMESHQPCLQQTAEWLQPGTKNPRLRLDLLPVHHAGDSTGLLLKLHP
jgi:two-component system CheB/CheR fusion protein